MTKYHCNVKIKFLGNYKMYYKLSLFRESRDNEIYDVIV